MEGMDRSRARQAVVHPGAVEDRGVRDRPSTRRRVPNGDALAGREEFDNVGCYLQIVENELLVWTDALEPGFRPTRRPPDESAGSGIWAFTGVIRLAAHGKGTKYTAMAIHRTLAERKAHEAMGFHEGWGKALDQLVELAGSWKKR